NVQEGARVKAGEVLFRLDARMAQAARRAAEAKVKVAEARVRAARGDEQAVARAELDVAHAQLELAALALERHIVVAPFDGVVVRLDAQPGTYTNPKMFGLASSAGLCELADLSAVYVDVFISEDQVGRVRVGQSCEVWLDSDFRQMHPGKVNRIGRV